MKIEKNLLWPIIVAEMGSLIFGVNMAAISGTVSSIFLVFTVVGFVFILAKIPEIKGKSLE